MCRRPVRIKRLLPAIAVLLAGTVLAEDVLVSNGGFDSGLTAPWGTGLYSEGRPVWWNSGGCKSTADIDEAVAKEGLVSLHIVNASSRAANVYGTTAQRIRIEPNRPYRITIWARAFGLASTGAVNVVVDDAWTVRPISLPAGSFSWTRFSGTFSLPADHADIRILSEDAGEAWVDAIRVIPLDENLY